MIGATARGRDLSLGPGPVIGATARGRDLSLGPDPVIGRGWRGGVIGGSDGGRKRFRGGRRYMQTGNQDYHGHRYNIGRRPYANTWFPLTYRQVRFARLFHDK